MIDPEMGVFRFDGSRGSVEYRHKHGSGLAEISVCEVGRPPLCREVALWSEDGMTLSRGLPMSAPGWKIVGGPGSPGYYD